MSSVVIVGAGLGGLRTAEALRSRGFNGDITVVGAEPWYPYNRPPLSKEALRGEPDITALEFHRRASVEDVSWRLGVVVDRIDAPHHLVHLMDGSTLPADAVVVATGLRPRRLDAPGPTQGRFALRTLDDAQHLRAHLRADAHVVVVGAGFVGGEVASTARSLGCHVDVVAVEAVPLARPLGHALGAALQRRHESDGVRFHLQCTVKQVEGTDQVTGVTLDNGTSLRADVLVEAVGSVPNTECLRDIPGIDLSDGVLTDDYMRVVGSPMPIAAVGDVARFPNHLVDDVARRVEHWSMPTDTGRRAGATVAALLAHEPLDAAPFTPLPSFWTDQAGVTVQSFGAPGLADEIRIVDGEPANPSIVEYWRAGRLVGVVGVDRTADLAAYRSRLLTA